MSQKHALWVYKCNAHPRSDQMASGDWDDEFSWQPRQEQEWGGTTTTSNPVVLGILWERMRSGDLILAWQTDRRAAIGLCRVRLEDRHGERDMWLTPIQHFKDPVKLHEIKKRDRVLAKVRALQQGRIQMLYETSPAEARALLRACRARRGAFSSVRPTRPVTTSSATRVDTRSMSR